MRRFVHLSCPEPTSPIPVCTCKVPALIFSGSTRRKSRVPWLLMLMALSAVHHHRDSDAQHHGDSAGPQSATWLAGLEIEPTCSWFPVGGSADSCHWLPVSSKIYLTFDSDLQQSSDMFTDIFTTSAWLLLCCHINSSLTRIRLYSFLPYFCPQAFSLQPTTTVQLLRTSWSGSTGDS